MSLSNFKSLDDLSEEELIELNDSLLASSELGLMQISVEEKIDKAEKALMILRELKLYLSED